MSTKREPPGPLPHEMEASNDRGTNTGGLKNSNPSRSGNKAPSLVPLWQETKGKPSEVLLHPCDSHWYT